MSWPYIIGIVLIIASVIIVHYNIKELTIGKYLSKFIAVCCSAIGFYIISYKIQSALNLSSNFSISNLYVKIILILFFFVWGANYIRLIIKHKEEELKSILTTKGPIILIVASL